MIRTIALTAALTVTLTATGAQAQPQTYTAYTPDGAQVVMVSVDPGRYDDDKVLQAPAEALEYMRGDYTLYTICPEGVVELWGYGYGTPSTADDIVADWQVWEFPSVKACEGYR